LQYQLNGMLWVGVPLISTFCITLAGYWGVRGVVNKPPMQVFREF